MNWASRLPRLRAGRSVAYAALILSLGATLWAWSVARAKETVDTRLRFQRYVVRGTSRVEDQLRSYEALLKGARALFAASDDVTSADWRTFADTIGIADHYPGVRALAYIEVTTVGELPEYVERARRTDPSFSLRPGAPDRPPDTEVRICRFAEPKESNLGVLGLDLSTRPDIAPVMDLARDTGNVAMSPIIQLAQDDHPKPSVGIYLPIYDVEADADTVEARRAALRGWVAAAVNVQPVIEATARELPHGLEVNLFDQTDSDAPRVVVSTSAEATAEGESAELDDRTYVSFGHRQWSLRFTGRAELVRNTPRLLGHVTLASGIGLSLALFGALRTLARTGQVAQRLAGEMTASLRESEARYQAAIAATRQIFYDWNAATNQIIVGGALREILGRDPAEVTVLAHWEELVHPDDRAAFHHEIERVLATKEAFNLEYRLRRADGSYAIVHDSGCFFQDAEGNVSRMVGFAMDVTERRCAEEERRQSDERFRTLFEHSGVPLLLFLNGRVIDCNEAAVRILNAPAKIRLIGREPHEFSPETQDGDRPSRERAAEVFAQVEREGRACVEWRCQRFTGEQFTVNAVLSSVTLGGIRLVLAGWHDLTELRRAEAEQRRLQRVLQIAVDAMPQRVFWKDKTGTYLGCNRAFAQDAGFRNVSDIVGKTDFDMVWRAHAHAYRTDDFAIMASGRPVLNFHEKITNASGCERWLRTSKIPLLDEMGRTIGILGTFEDITDEREAKNELRRARDAAESASRAKSEFLANMSHEIRTPMNAIMGYADLLADPDQPPAAREECIRTIRRNSEHLLTIINDILDLSKIEAGKMGVERVTFSPATVVREVIDMAQARASAKGIALEAVFDSPIPDAITSDPTRLRQMLINLVGNAVKFTDHGSVRLRVAMEPSCDDADAWMRFDVIDTGIGMTPEVIARLFQPFTQADSSVTRRFGGTGLGLTITRRLADLLGGELSVVSRPREGSTFTLRLRVQTPTPDQLATPITEPVAEQAPLPATTPQRLTGRILLVEDGPDNQRLVAHLLRAAGAEVEIAENGQEALDRIADRAQPPFDMVLMDMQMPVLDGYSATRRLRERGCTLPIVAFTAHAMAGERERCLQAGCDDYATKPVVRAQLLALCARWILAERRMQASVRS